MKLLLDTHAFLWWSMDRAKLSAHALRAYMDHRNTLILSVVSTWELQIKLQLGKLKFSRPLKTLITNEQLKNQLEILPVTLEHIWILGQFPLHHRDPFDRLLIARQKLRKLYWSQQILI